MKVYAVSYRLDSVDGKILDFFSRKTDAIKRARELHAEDEQVSGVHKLYVPTKKADMIGFLAQVNDGSVYTGEKVPWGGK